MTTPVDPPVDKLLTRLRQLATATQGRGNMSTSITGLQLRAVLAWVEHETVRADELAKKLVAVEAARVSSAVVEGESWCDGLVRPFQVVTELLEADGGLAVRDRLVEWGRKHQTGLTAAQSEAIDRALSGG